MPDLTRSNLKALEESLRAEYEAEGLSPTEAAVQAREACTPKTTSRSGTKVIAGRQLLVAQEAADHLGVSKSRFYQMVREDQVPSVRLGGRIYLDLDALGELIARATSDVKPEEPRRGHARRRPAASLAKSGTTLDDLYREVTGKKGKK